MIKTILGVCDKVRLILICSKTSNIIDFLHAASLAIVLYKTGIIKALTSGLETQDGLRLCRFHAAKSGLWLWLPL